MRKILIFSMLISCFFISSCGMGSKINGSSIKTAYRSIRMLKSRLPVEQRIAFEISFWSMRDAHRDNGEFLDLVDGKTPEEIIEAGKKIFQESKSAGIEEYQEYSSWDEMINKFTKERMDQGKSKKGRKDPREDHSVIYKL
jgi:hypothetical protein